MVFKASVVVPVVQPTSSCQSWPSRQVVGIVGRVAVLLLLLLAFCLLIALSATGMETMSSASSCQPSSEPSVVIETNERQSQYPETTCSLRAFLSGGRKKVLGYIYYDDNQTTMAETRKYFQGINLNAQMNQKIFPGWEMWLYHDLVEDEKLRSLEDLEAQHGNLFLCDVRSNPMFGNTVKLNPRLWRFLPLCDSQVEVLASRDLDSVASERELNAVDAWIASKHPFHVMRDHPGHDAPMLAGMWGAKISGIRDALRRTMLQVLKDKSAYAPRWVTSNDQALLEKYFWPWAKDLSLQHDSYTCENFAKSRPWPSQRDEEEPNNFVGAPFALNASVSEECPLRCRPKEHQEWKHC